MAKKADLEHAHNSYHHSCEIVARLTATHSLHEAIAEAERSLPLLHPAIAYQRRFLKLDEPTVPTLDCLLRYSPPLFLRRAINAAERWYLGGTRTERNALPEMPQRLENARRLLHRSTELWTTLCQQPGSRIRPDSRYPGDSEIVTTWLRIGAIAEIKNAGASEYLRPSDPRRPRKGKCFECGHVLAVPLTRLLTPFPCPSCRKPTQFVIISRFI